MILPALRNAMKGCARFLISSEKRVEEMLSVLFAALQSLSNHALGCFFNSLRKP